MTPSEIDHVKKILRADRARVRTGRIDVLRAPVRDRPSLRSMFGDDLKQQSKKLMQVLATVANGLDRIDTLLPAVKALGERHVGYGVSEAHYETVGEALIWTLGKGLGEAFTADVKSAGLTAYTTLSQVMKTAAARAGAIRLQRQRQETRNGDRFRTDCGPEEAQI